MLPPSASNLFGRAGVRDKVWQRSIVAEMGDVQQPRFAAVAGDEAARLADALRAVPGSYILKPRLGSNGFCVVRIVSDPAGCLTVATDCPDTADYLAEYPTDPAQRSRDR